MEASSLVEVVLECLQLFVPAANAAQPPCTQEACTVADELDEACPDGKDAYLHALVAYGTVDEDECREEQQGQEEYQHSADAENDEKHRTIGAAGLGHTPYSNHSYQGQQHEDEGKEQTGKCA